MEPRDRDVSSLAHTNPSPQVNFANPWEFSSSKSGFAYQDKLSVHTRNTGFQVLDMEF